MITFLGSIALLLLGYFIYSKVIEKLLDVNPNNISPSQSMADGVDFVPMKKNKNALIQLLNIAGTGPIFGPILAALYGPLAMIWIVIGCIFAGAVHDFLIGIISMRNKGQTLPLLAESFLFRNSKHVVNLFSGLLLLLVATVFVVGPSNLIHNLLPSVSLQIIMAVVFIYYILATLLPIDKIIGRIYPFFTLVLVLGAMFIMVSIFVKAMSGTPLPELHLNNLHPSKLPIYPLLFLTLSCGALSGFHATQTPLVARTLENESQGRYVFYGMMIAEGVIALIWCYATIMMLDGKTLLDLINKGTPSLVVDTISFMTLGPILGTIIVLGAIVLPITSGDTAFRGLRIMIAEYLGINQTPIINRIMVIAPFFILSFALTFMDFQLLWQYFSWANQMLATIALWIGTTYLIKTKKPMWVALCPSLFITHVVVTYILSANIGFRMDIGISKSIAYIVCIVLLIIVLRLVKKQKTLIQ